MNYPDGRSYEREPRKKKGPKPSKYHNKKTLYNDILFDSKKEATRYQDLLLLEKGGIIRDIELQPRYDLMVNGQKLGYYRGDFRYEVIATSTHILEDVKSPATRTPVYMLKKKLVKALYGIEIVEV